MEQQPKDLAHVFGENFRAVRKQHEITLDEVARSARKYGARWTASRVGDLENGRFSVTVQNLCIASWTLSGLAGKAIAPADLVASDHPVTVAGDFAVQRNVIAETLKGEVVSLKLGDIPSAVDKLVTSAQQGFDNLSKFDDVGLADRRAAKKLGVDVDQLSYLALKLWGDLLSVEVEKRAPAGASPQAKGQITRKLIEEIREELSRGND